MTLKRVLIVKIGAIGDVVMALPLLTYFREKKTPVHITWVCGEMAAPLLKATQTVDQLLTVNESFLFKGSLFLRLKELLKIQAKLAGQFFDLIIIGHVNWRYKLPALFAKCKEQRSLHRSSEKQCPVPGRYHADEYLRLASGIEDSSMPRAKIPLLHLPTSNYIPQKSTTIAIAPGGAKNILAEEALRRWPIQYYVELAQKLQNRGISIILTGSSSDEWVFPFFSELACINFIGKLDLLDLISLYQKCNLVITHDSGPLHLAKLAGCPAIGLFGPTNPWEKVSREEKIEIIWGGENLACRPCYDGKKYAPCQKNECLHQIKPDLVLQKALCILYPFHTICASDKLAFHVENNIC